MSSKPLAQAIAELKTPEQRQSVVLSAIAAELKKVDTKETGTPTATLEAAPAPGAAAALAPAPTSAPAPAASPTSAPAPAAGSASPAPASDTSSALLREAQAEYNALYGGGAYGHGSGFGGLGDDDDGMDGFGSSVAGTAANVANTALNNAANFSGIIDRPIPEKLHEWIEQIFTTRRAHTSQGDQNFRRWLRATIEGMGFKVQDMSGNLVVVNVVKRKKSTVLFSCHIDTCHSMEESNGQRQALTYDSVMGELFLATPEQGRKPGCLGADDGAGIYIMLRMLKANVPGSYVFHIGEERGCIGSNLMLTNHEEFLKKHTHAIAFDRPNDEEVIVTQSNQECASTAAGTAIAAVLHTASGGMVDLKVSHRGVVTDTKVYRYSIRECINIGVGYSKQHSSSEVQDIAYLECLTEAACKVDWSTIPVVRNFPVNRYETGQGYGGYGGGYSSGYGSVKSSQHQRDLDLGNTNAGKQGASVHKIDKVKKKKATVAEGIEMMLAMGLDDLRDWAEADPEGIAAYMAILISKYKGLQTEVENLQEFL